MAATNFSSILINDKYKGRKLKVTVLQIPELAAAVLRTVAQAVRLNWVEIIRFPERSLPPQPTVPLMTELLEMLAEFPRCCVPNIAEFASACFPSELQPAVRAAFR